MTEQPNRYGAQGNKDADGNPCCCHGVALSKTCAGCVDLEGTARRPSLVGVDPVGMNPLNDDGPKLDPDVGAAWCDRCGQESCNPAAVGEKCGLCGGIYRDHKQDVDEPDDLEPEDE